jgi:DEAD/DEAH box helicase
MQDIQNGIHQIIQSKLAAALADKRSARAVNDAADKVLFMLAQSFMDQATENDKHRVERLHAAALAYYLSGHYAQAFVILQDEDLEPYIESPYGYIRHFLRRNFDALEICRSAWVDAPTSDSVLSEAVKLGNRTVAGALETLIYQSICESFLAAYEFAKSGGDGLDKAIERLEVFQKIAQCVETGLTPEHVWVVYLTILLLREHRNNALRTQLGTMLSEPAKDIPEAYVSSAAKRSNPLLELWRSQVVAVPKINEHASHGRPNLVVRAPTSAGKTNIAELTILRFLMDFSNDEDTKCVYIAPFRILAAEVEQKLRKHLAPLKLVVAHLYGGAEVSLIDRSRAEKARILVATPEKIAAFVRHDAKLMQQVKLVIFDEGHTIEHDGRGLRYEMLIHRLVQRYKNTATRIVFVSAFLGDTKVISDWIGSQDSPASTIESNYRPTANHLGVVRWDETNRTLWKVTSHSSSEASSGYRRLSPYPTDAFGSALSNTKGKYFPRTNDNKILGDVTALAGIWLSQHGATTLIYSPKPDWCNSVAEAILYGLAQSQNAETSQPTLRLPKIGSEQERRWQHCINTACNTVGENTLIVRALRAGIALHHRNLPEKLRDAIAFLIQNGVLPIIVATSTVINGINTPVRTVLLHSLAHYDTGTSLSGPMKAANFMNLAGRAGRAMQEASGYALVVSVNQAKASSNLKQIQQYVSQANQVVLKGRLRPFLLSVRDTWQLKHGGASLPELCAQLADDKTDWLSRSQLDQLGEVDAGLLAAIEEMGLSDDPDRIQEIWDRSLLVLHSSDDPELEHLLVLAIKSRASRLTSLPKMKRFRFYRAGLAVSDCLILEEYNDQIVAQIRRLADFNAWTDAQRCDFIVKVTRDVLCKLAILEGFKPVDIEVILKHWLLGHREGDIAQLPEVTDQKLSQEEVAQKIDDLCVYKLPTAMHALTAYATSQLTSEETNAAEGHDLFESIAIESVQIESAIRSCASMVSFGVPSAAAASFMSAGIESRLAAIHCARHYAGSLDSIGAILHWIS